MKQLSQKLTYANVMATIAVFMALGGGAYAATQLKKNSVGAKQLKNGAVTGTKVKDGTLEESKLTTAAVAALRGAKGLAGDRGAEGAKGSPGESKVVAVAASGPSDWETSNPASANFTEFTVPTTAQVLVQGSGELTTNCPPPGANVCKTSVALYIDNEPISESQSTNLSGGGSLRLPISIPAVATVTAGTHTAELRYLASLADGGSASLFHSAISVIAVQP